MTKEMLSDWDCRSAEPGPKEYKLADGDGLNLHILPSGAKSWRFRFRALDGKVGPQIAAKEPGKDRKFADQTVVLGKYDALSLAGARRLADDLRRQIAEGINPILVKRDQEAKRAEDTAATFAHDAERFQRKHRAKWSATHARDVERMANEMIAAFGSKPFADITERDLRRLFDAITKRREGKRSSGATYMRDVKTYYAAILRHVNSQRSADRQIPDVSRYVQLDEPPAATSHAHLPPQAVGELLRKLEFSDATPLVRIATRLLLLTMVRTGELRQAKWAEVDTKAVLWRFAPERMKARRAHLVPLSTQALALFAELRKISGESEWCFPSFTDSAQPISENTILAALYRMGYKGKMTGHGARSIASTWLHEQGYPSDAVERQLAHAPRDRVKSAYLHGEFLPQRAAMLQAWADQLDTWEREAAGAVVLPFARVCARQTSSNLPDGITTTTLHVGGQAGKFRVATGNLLAGNCDVDIDGNGVQDALTDGLMHRRQRAR